MCGLAGVDESTPHKLDIEATAHTQTIVLPLRCVIPIRDDNPTARRAWVTLFLIALNVLVYALVQPHNRQSVVSPPELSSAIAVPDPDLRFTLSYAAIPCEVLHRRPLSVGEAIATFGRTANQKSCGLGDPAPLFPAKRAELALLVSMFLHGGLLHLGGNMLFLWVFGNNIEDRFGRARFLAFYLLGGAVAAFAHIAAQPTSTVPIVGASGAVAAVMGAYLVLYPRAQVTTAFTFFLIFVRRISAAWLLAFWFVSQFFVSPGSGVAWVAHVGGFLFGAATGLLVRVMSASGASSAARSHR